MAEQSKYEVLVNRNISLPAPRLMQMADSLMRVGAEEEAMVFYIIVASRDDRNLSASDLRSCVQADLKIGDIHYSKETIRVR